MICWLFRPLTKWKVMPFPILQARKWIAPSRNYTNIINDVGINRSAISS